MLRREVRMSLDRASDGVSEYAGLRILHVLCRSEDLYRPIGEVVDTPTQLGLRQAFFRFAQSGLTLEAYFRTLGLWELERTSAHLGRLKLRRMNELFWRKAHGV